MTHLYGCAERPIIGDRTGLPTVEPDDGPHIASGSSVRSGRRDRVREVAMKVRAGVVAGASGAALCWSPSARAQEPAPAAASPPAVDVPTVNIVDVARFFTAPRALGDAWERAVQAVLDGMRVVVEAERAAAQRTLAAVPPK